MKFIHKPPKKGHICGIEVKHRNVITSPIYNLHSVILSSKLQPAIAATSQPQLQTHFVSLSKYAA